MRSKEEVYDAFAELIYCVVMADGEIKETEQAAIKTIVKNHPIGGAIQKYFDSKNKDISIVQSFLHTLEICKEHGADDEYPFLLAIIEVISKVSEGLDEGEDGLLAQFILNFKRRFSLN